MKKYIGPFIQKTSIYTICVRCKESLEIVANYNNDYYLDVDHECIPHLRPLGYRGIKFTSVENEKKFDLILSKYDEKLDKFLDDYIDNEAKEIYLKRMEENGEWCKAYIMSGRHNWKCNTYGMECQRWIGKYPIEKGSRADEWIKIKEMRGK